jgi:hypothetical protein
VLRLETKTGEDRDVERWSLVADAPAKHPANFIEDNLDPDSPLFQPGTRPEVYM